MYIRIIALLSLGIMVSVQSITLGQNQPVKITWTGAQKVKGPNGELTILTTWEGFSIPEHSMIPYYRLVLPGIETNNVQIQNPVYQALTDEESKIHTASELLANDRIKISHGISKRQIHTIIDFPLLKVNTQTGATEKLTQFDYTYQEAIGSSGIDQSATSSRRITNKFNSVLGDGEIFRIGVPSSGIYKMDYAFLNTIGVDLSSIDPRNLHLYGNGEGMLPQANSAPRVSDLEENAIFIEGESDGAFNQSDYILFYGKGPDNTYFDNSAQVFRHTKNLYTDTSYYFLKVANTSGKRITNAAQPVSGQANINVYDEHIWHERDLFNIILSGREWYGEDFNLTLTRNFFYNLPGIQPGQVKMVSSVLGRSPAENASGVVNSTFLMRFNGDSIGGNSIPPVGTPPYGIRGIQANSIFTRNLTSGINSINIEYIFSKGASQLAIGNLNYFDLTFKRALALYGASTSFRSLDSRNFSTVSYAIGGINSPATTKVWEITNWRDIRAHLFTVQGNIARFDAFSDTLNEFIVFNGSNFPAPRFFNKISNQNLHSIVTPTFLIVTHPSFLAKANELAAWRNQRDGYSVYVATTDQVYNEFSSGGQDVSAIRDFAKFLYDNNESGTSLKYLMLFGDCSYDFKYRTPINTNLVAIYQSRESLNDLASYGSDDFFGFLDNNEGEWPESPPYNSNLLDIGIGRIPAKNIQEATTMVNKIKSYETLPALGSWRNSVTLIADDEDSNAHFNACQGFANIIESKDSSYNIQKIYIDAYNQIDGPNGRVSPEAKAEVNNAVDRGSLIFNYYGHGNTSRLASENVVDVEQISSWSNSNKLALWITATCEFGRYDDPAKNSGAEVMIFNSNGGAVGMLTTGRPVFASANTLINNAFFNSAFTYPGNVLPTLGDVMILTKNASLTDIGIRNFGYLGDPSMKLAYPKEKMFITEINGVPLTGVKDTISPLSLVTIKGEVRGRQANSLITDFSGLASITVFDRKAEVQTKGDGVSGFPASFSQLRNRIFSGDVAVFNGIFNVSFVVPKDVSSSFSVGKISMYAKKSNTYLDAHGHSFDIVIGGTADSVTPDNDPPIVQLFMDDESFANGGITAVNTTLLANLFDDNGINLSRSIGHEISAKLIEGGSCPQSTTENNNSQIYTLNDYYQSELNSYQKGKISYPLKGLNTGYYSINVTAWDTHLNSGKACIEFLVAKDEDIVIKYILNYPNPFSTNTNFHFDHNQSGKDLSVLLQVYTVSGRLVKTLDAFFPSSKTRITDIHWNGTDDFGDKLAKGVYIYKLSVRVDNKEKHEYQKLVILN